MPGKRINEILIYFFVIHRKLWYNESTMYKKDDPKQPQTRRLSGIRPVRWTMIHNERVRHMVHLQAFNDRKGKEYFPIVRYFRGDYVGLQLLSAFVSGTVSYGILLVIWVVCNMEMLMTTIHTMDLRQFTVDIVLRYLGFMLVYLIAVYIYAQIRYTRAKKEVKGYNRHLKRLMADYEQDGGKS